MNNEAMAAIVRGQESVNALKMLTNKSADPTVEAHLDNILHCFSLISFFLHCPKSKSTAKQSLSKKCFQDEGEEEEDRVFHTVDSPTLILDDGFLWRKYGQKIIKGSLYQRSYYRCLNAKHQNCNAKKQVQKIQDNPSLFKTVYIGRHVCKRAIILYSTNNNIHNSTSTVQFENQDQTMNDSNLPILVSVETDNHVVDGHLDFSLTNPEEFSWLTNGDTMDFENYFDFNH